MKNLNPWDFGIVFILVFIFLSFNETNFNLLFAQKKEKIDALLLKTEIGYGMRGQGYKQYVSFSFQVKENKK
jgi:hypothetical protein